MKDDGLDVSVVIPVYNEEARILNSLERSLEFLSHKTNWRWEIVVSDDGSKDRTEAIVKSLAEKQGRGQIRFITEGRHLGKGGAVMRGMLEARGRYRFMADADFSTPIKELDRFIDEMQNGFDIVIGSRAISRPKDCDVQQSFRRRVAGRIFNLFVRLIVLKGFKDTQCGFKCFTSAAAEDLFRELKCGGFAFDVEALCRAKKKGYKIKEIPVMWRESASSKVRLFRDSVRMVKDLFYLRRVLSKT